MIQHLIPLRKGVYSGLAVHLCARISGVNPYLIIIVKLTNPITSETIRKLKVTYYLLTEWNLSDAIVDAYNISYRYAEELESGV